MNYLVENLTAIEHFEIDYQVEGKFKALLRGASVKVNGIDVRAFFPKDADGS